MNLQSIFINFFSVNIIQQLTILSIILASHFTLSIGQNLMLIYFLAKFIYSIMQQAQSNKKITSFPPIQKLLQRYNSLPPNISSIKYSQASVEKSPSFVSKKSINSCMSSDRRKLYISKSPSFFKRALSYDLNQHKNSSPASKDQLSGKQIKRLVDRQNVIATFKTIPQPRPNPRFAQKTENIMKISNYSNFSPFKRNHAISRQIPKVQLISRNIKWKNNVNQI